MSTLAGRFGELAWEDSELGESTVVIKLVIEVAELENTGEGEREGDRGEAFERGEGTG